MLLCALNCNFSGSFVSAAAPFNNILYIKQFSAKLNCPAGLSWCGVARRSFVDIFLQYFDHLNAENHNFNMNLTEHGIGFFFINNENRFVPISTWYLYDKCVLRKSFFLNSIKANTLRSEENAYFIGAYSSISSLPEKALLKVRIHVCLKLLEAIWLVFSSGPTIVRLKSKSITLVSLERKDNRLHFWNFKETVLQAVPNTDPNH